MNASLESQKEKKGRKVVENLQIIAENFPNVGRDLDIHVLRLIGNSGISIKKKKNLLRHIIIKCLKLKRGF